MFLVAPFVISLGVAVTLFTLGLLMCSRKSHLIFDKYPCKGFFYYIKYPVALLVMKYLRNRIYHRNEQQRSSAEHLAAIDQPQCLASNPESYDSVSFMAANQHGYKLLCNMERRHSGECRIALYLCTPDLGVLSLPKSPGVVPQADSINFECNGLKIYPEASMSKWHLEYNGEMINSKNESVTVDLNLRFSSGAQYFDYNRDLSSSLIADATAREAWNIRFYNMLRNIDSILEKRTHYEQNGSLAGALRIGGKESKLELRSFRDHSFGIERCLSTIHRYVYFTLFLDDGTCMVLGNLSQPTFFLSSLKVGYICTVEGTYEAIKSSNYELYSYGEKGTPPQHQNFIVNTANRTFFVQIKCDESVVRYVGTNWESKIYNQFVTCTVNGVQGQGIVEYLYRLHSN